MELDKLLLVSGIAGAAVMFLIALLRCGDRGEKW